MPDNLEYPLYQDNGSRSRNEIDAQAGMTGPSSKSINGAKDMDEADQPEIWTEDNISQTTIFGRCVSTTTLTTRLCKILKTSYWYCIYHIIRKSMISICKFKITFLLKVHKTL